MANASSKKWKTARYPKEITKALEREGIPKRILVIGCGLEEAAFYADSMPDVEVVGVDFHSDLIAKAQEIFPRPRVTYLHADALDLQFVNQCNLEPESFGAVVLTGLFSNVIFEKDIRQLFQNVNTVLAPGGRVVISDYLLVQREQNSSWDDRYIRDLIAILNAGMFDEEDSEVIPPFGVIVIDQEDYLQEM